jgi:hypothetical protein
MTLNQGRRIGELAGAAALAIALTLAARPARANDTAEAEALIRQGVELRSQKKDERALPLFEKAYQLSRTPRTAGQLGLVEMALGYFVDADRYLSEAVASPDHPWVAKNLATLKAQLATAKSQIGELYIIGEPVGAEVLVNGKPVGKLPLSAPIRLDKGRADVQVRAPGYTATSDSIVMVGGKREDRSYRLAREAVAAPVAPTPAAVPPPAMPPPTETKPPGPSVALSAPPPASAGAGSNEPAAAIATTSAAPGGDDHSSLRPYAWGAGIAGAAGLVFGAFEGITAIKKRNDFNNHMGPDPSTGGQITDCATTDLTPACKSIKDSWSTARTLSIVGLVAGAVLAGGAAALWVVSSPKEHAGSTSALACAPDVGVGSRGVACQLRF